MTEQAKFPIGTPVRVRRPSIRSWPQSSVKGVVVGYTESGKIKVETGLGIRVYASRYVQKAY